MSEQKPSIPALSPQCQLQYVAEGAANIIYSFISSSNLSSPPSSASQVPTIPGQDAAAHAPESPSLRTRLLRLRKAQASPITTLHLHNWYRTAIAPRFPTSELLAHDLIRVPPLLIQSLNTQLKAREAGAERPQKRCGQYLDEEEQYGLLVTDMRPCTREGEILVEFKPKWLVQSPSAPRDSKRCRTCALRAARRAWSCEMPGTGRDREEVDRSFCPLDLVAEDQQRHMRAVSGLVACGALPDSAELRERMLGFLRDNDLLRRLRDNQRDLDKEGVLGDSLESEDFLVATTLRDCTLFIKDGGGKSSRMEVRLGDFDLKSPTPQKIQYWREIEDRLIQEGWYTGTEAEEHRSAIRCILTT